MSGGGGHREARLELLAELPPSLEEPMLHVLACRECCETLWTALDGDEPDEAAGEIPEAAFTDLLGLAEAASREEEEFREKLALFLSATSERQEELIRDWPTEPDSFIAFLLRRAEASGSRDCVALCQLGWELLKEGFPASVADPARKDRALWTVRFNVLFGNALREEGEQRKACEVFEATSFRLGEIASDTPLQALAAAALCRWWGALRWETGEPWLAEALLRQSARGYGELGLGEEEGISRTLLGLLLAERRDTARAICLLQVGRAAFEPGGWPWLSLQARCAEALEMARLGYPERAEKLLTAAVCPQESMLLDDPRALWLYGRVWAVMGEGEAAETLLEQARVQLLAEGDLGLSALCIHDLATLLVPQGRQDELDRLAREWLARFQPAKTRARKSPLLEIMAMVMQTGSEVSLGKHPQTGGDLLRKLLRRNSYGTLPPIAGPGAAGQVQPAH